ncbi:macro domain-containing protein [Azospirillum halopraeferens]|uniref:macro domain-containing protein n=1 Tax=Azospirillum halopraeferens TaxID=34010 RepID=UPI0003F78209|nr:macro domain-containing protein [Azospirillum halopraeferens]
MAPRGDGVVTVAAGGGTITIAVGDITQARVDAIVNAANGALRRGGGVDGAIHRAAGPALQDELDRFGGCPTGECRVTGGHALPARTILHCVGPVWQGGGHGEDALLERCYRSAFAEARRLALRSIAFPAISTGIFGFPKERAAAVALAAARDELARPPAPAEVRFICFDDETAEIYRRLLRTPDGGGG